MNTVSLTVVPNQPVDIERELHDLPAEASLKLSLEHCTFGVFTVHGLGKVSGELADKFF